ncbi:PDZ and LIM domain protein 1, partial [Opisthocomus hoazin]
VTPGSKAAVANLCIGDQIIAIDGENTENMTHLEAQNKIKGCTDELTLTVSRTESKVWSPLVNEEGKTHPYKMNLASQPQVSDGVSACSSSHLLPSDVGAVSGLILASGVEAPPRDHPALGNLRSQTPSLCSEACCGGASRMPRHGPVEVEVPGLKVLHVQFNSPLQLYSQSNIMDSLQGQISSVSPDFPRESEVYKMLQENQELNEPPRQSASFLVLQEILESEEKGDPPKPSGFRSVKAPTTKVASSIGNAQKLPMCEKCGAGIVGVFVKIRDKQRHPECYVCSDCGTNLKQKGHFFVEDQIYCEKHARERVVPPEGYEVVTVFPK